MNDLIKGISYWVIDHPRSLLSYAPSMKKNWGMALVTEHPIYQTLSLEQNLQYFAPKHHNAISVDNLNAQWVFLFEQLPSKMIVINNCDDYFTEQLDQMIAWLKEEHNIDQVAVLIAPQQTFTLSQFDSVVFLKHRHAFAQFDKSQWLKACIEKWNVEFEHEISAADFSAIASLANIKKQDHKLLDFNCSISKKEPLTKLLEKSGNIIRQQTTPITLEKLYQKHQLKVVK